MASQSALHLSDRIADMRAARPGLMYKIGPGSSKRLRNAKPGHASGFDDQGIIGAAAHGGLESRSARP